MTAARPYPALIAVAALALAACSSDPTLEGVLAPDTRVAAFDSAEVAAGYNAHAGLRVRAVEAFRGARAALDTSFVMHTIEGTPIRYRVVATRGSAVLTIDERADGGGVRTETVTSLALVLIRPAVWRDGVEVAKEQVVEVEPADARRVPGTYYLRGRCAAQACEVWL
jgi:hypothetical protein